MRQIKKIILHCSALGYGNAKQIDGWHRKKGWDGIGYHYVVCNGLTEFNGEYDVKLDGKIETGRPLERPGAHCEGNNYDSIGVCLIGKDKFTHLQIESLLTIIERMRERFGKIAIYGHYEMKSGIKQGKTCPNIDMVEFRKEWSLN